MQYFTEAEHNAFNGLKYDSDLKPYFDPMRYCLRWKDEEPPSVTREIYEKLLDLVMVRSFLHKGLPENQWNALEPGSSYFADLWKAAEIEIPHWPGFKRKVLSFSENAYWLGEIAKDPSEHF